MNDHSIIYNNIFAPGSPVTGIRQDAGDGEPVVISGGCPGSGGKLRALLYRGPLYPSNAAGYAYLTPVFPCQTVTSALFYGPNTPLFNPEMGAGNVRAVGSYQYSEGGALDHAMMYQGGLDGSGAWTQLDVPEAVAGAPVANTIAHSTMGDLVVGNYDLAGTPGSANAFIRNIKTGGCTVLGIGPLATAYGVWQNGGAASSSYTIAGGYQAGAGINRGFLLDYDAETGAVTHLTSFTCDDSPGLATHFEGITGVEGGYSLAGTGDSGAVFATIPRNADGSFGAAKWIPVANPASQAFSTGNSMLANNLIGIYEPASGTVQSYVATVTVRRQREMPAVLRAGSHRPSGRTDGLR